MCIRFGNCRSERDNSHTVYRASLSSRHVPSTEWRIVHKLWLDSMSLGAYYRLSGEHIAACRSSSKSPQYGYHISVLNQIQAVLTCKSVNPANAATPSNCIPMSDVAFSFVTAIFTVGGLAGSLVANLVVDSWGRRGTQRLCAIFIGIGSALMGLTSSLSILLVGRFLIGIGSGLGLCVGPIFLAEIAPTSISGSVG